MSKTATIAIIQARNGSVRLPKKGLRQVGDFSVLGLLIERLKRAKLVSQIVVATTDNSEDDSLVDHVLSMGVKVYRGSSDNVLERYFEAAKAVRADYIVRITGDCPLVDPELVDLAVSLLIEHDYDYVSNTNPPSFPDGFDIEAFSRYALEAAAEQAQDKYDYEHVTPWMKRNISKTYNFESGSDSSHLRVTIDEQRDLDHLHSVMDECNWNYGVHWQKVVEILTSLERKESADLQPKRNEGATMGAGQKLWKRAKAIIPGGNMLLSKRSEMFLPDLWPSYFESSSGCSVVDLDGKNYIDMSIMGIGTNSLGYGNEEVDAKVLEAVKKGNMSTLNCPEEVWLADQLLEINPWADMVKLARTGGEANAVAVRIARAASGRDNIAICGYHGWHDWYLASNLSDDKNLDGHLLPGLSPVGVPRNLKGSVFPFTYNDFKGLLKLVSDNNIGTIMMEVSRNFGPEEGFLESVRKLSNQKGIVLIFDECTSGFRETYGGLHQKYEVEPDIAMYGKALGNGYAITAVVGRRDVMEASQASFISSTFWTERIGPTAALATLKVMKRLESWQIITGFGEYIRTGWQEIADRHGLEISHWGIPALAGFTIQSENSQAYKTYVTQEMLKRGYLAGNSVYSSTAHSIEIIDRYLENLDEVFLNISEFESKNRKPQTFLDGPQAHSGFQRLN
jgi:glutamate-1-semialdehyde 2,1-aminomutase